MFIKHSMCMTPKKMLRDAHFLLLNVDDSYNYNMYLVDLSDQLRSVYLVYHWMRKYKWCWSLLFWGHGIVLFNAYIVYKTICGEGKVKSMDHYEFRCLVFLANIDPTTFGGRDHLVSAVQ